MKVLWSFGAIAALLLMAGTVLGADAIATGAVKSVDANKKQFVLTDSGGKESKFKLADHFAVNRGGQVSQGDLKPNDMVQVHYDKGLLSSTAKYILVQEGDSKNWTLAHGNLKNYDAGKKEVTFTDDQGKDWMYPMGDATVRINDQDGNIADIKIGDHVLFVADTTQTPATLKSMVAEHK